jgi:hypothetical protein
MSPTTACKTIKHSISLASSGDSIIVAAGTYTENLTIGFSLRITGSGATTTIIDGGGAARVVTITNTSAFVMLSKITIRNGHAQTGAGVSNSGVLTIANGTISGNTAFFGTGGGISNSGVLTITNATISGNKAFFRGGGVDNVGRLTVNNSTISGNGVSGCEVFGGGINNTGTLTITNSTINANSTYAGCQHIGYPAISRGGGV